MAVISSINKWQGYTVGASRPVLYVAGSLSKHRKIIHEVISPHCAIPGKMLMEYDCYTPQQSHPIPVISWTVCIAIEIRGNMRLSFIMCRCLAA